MTRPTHDIIVVGASAGGVEALMQLVAGLPADLPAAVFVVLHISASSPSYLPAILSRHGPLPAVHPAGGGAIEAGRIYVAPPDRHLLLRRGYVELARGPRENRVRPAVDPLFRSAARAYGPRVVGVVLSGTLDDGALGLLAIAARGGTTVVQDPADALFDGMPRAALRHACVDYTVPVARIGPLLAHLAAAPALDGDEAMGDLEEKTPILIRRDIAAQAHDARSDETTIYTCPECGGTLWQIDHEGLTHFHCHVGHTYGVEALLGQMTEELEAALWRAVRMLTEKATLTRQLAGRMEATGHGGQAAAIAEQAALDDHHGQLIRDTLLQTLNTPLADALAAAQPGDEARPTPHGGRREAG